VFFKRQVVGTYPFISNFGSENIGVLLPVLSNAMTVIYIEAAATRWVDSTVPQIPPGLLVHQPHCSLFLFYSNT